MVASDEEAEKMRGQCAGATDLIFRGGRGENDWTLVGKGNGLGVGLDDDFGKGVSWGRV